MNPPRWLPLAELEPRSSFALLGPGFREGTAGGWLLLSELSPAPATAAGPRLVYAPFETAGRDSLVFQASRCEVVVPRVPRPTRLRVRLHDQGYLATVRTIREAIAAGDVYQVCHTLRADLSTVGPAPLRGVELCAHLLAPDRPCPRFAAWVRFPGGAELVSASPELLCETGGSRVQVEPMKGTAQPGAQGVLTASEKDAAELAMITDLLRNDLIPLCRPRSVRVPCPRRLVDVGYALQTVSDVVGELLPGRTLLDVLAAVHPGGSVTGAPKNAALAFIRQLEPEPRGAYCGALGLLEADRARCALLIRTASRDPHLHPGWRYGVGSGIVYDSDPQAELAEVRLKLQALGDLELEGA